MYGDTAALPGDHDSHFSHQSHFFYAKPRLFGDSG
jgi:hypothetical protein